MASTCLTPATIDRAITTPSNLERRRLCPGSARLEAGLSEPDTFDSARGRLFHRYFTNKNLLRDLLTPDEQQLLKTSDRLLADVLGVINLSDHEFVEAAQQHDCHVEQSITGLDGRLTGTPDQLFVWRQRETALVNDLKSGFKVVERAELNLQLRGYAVLAEGEHEVDRVYVSILQPRLWSPSDRVSLAQYDVLDIAKARKQIVEIIDRTEDPKAPLVAGEEQCRYCKAKLICPAFRKAIGMPLAKIKTEEGLSKLKREAEFEKLIKGCNDEQLEQLFGAIKLANAVDELVSAEIRRRIRDGKFVKFMLGKDSEARTIANVRRAIAKLALSNIGTREEMIELCTLSLHKVEDFYRSRHKGATWQQARDRIDRILKSVMVREPREPKILPREKKKK